MAAAPDSGTQAAQIAPGVGVPVPAPALRVVAATAGVLVAAGAITMALALVAAPGPWTQGYVSEAGATGLPEAWLYRDGLAAVAVGGGLLGGTLHRPAPAAAGLLMLAAALAVTASAVPCSCGCPLPPFQISTAADVVHAVASITGMVACAVAMALLGANRDVDRRLSRAARAGAGLTFPLGGAVGLAMLMLGRAPLTGALERGLLAVVAGWLITTATLIATDRLR